MKTGIKNSIAIAGFLAILATTVNSSSAAYFNTAALDRCEVQIINTLQTGSENQEVFILQSLLSRGGYLHAAPNGYFGPATRSALIRFQLENGIAPTGMVGPMTRNAINERLCDNDVRGDSLSYDMYEYGYGSYGYSSGTTYVDAYDPYVQVVSPTPTNPVVYVNPPTTHTPGVYTPSNTVSTSASTVSVPANTNNIYGSGVYSNSTNYAVTPATTNSQIYSTNIIYTPSAGYTYGIVPQAGVLTITTPVAHSVYNEGDTVTLAWTTSNLNASQYQILLENTSTSQSKLVAVTSAHNATFTLTKEVLDAVCGGSCSNNNTGTFRIVITAPITDIAGITSTFRAAVAPITIKRPFTNFGTVSITSNKNPVASGEVFKLYVNIPTGASWNTSLYGQYAFKIRAVCPAGVSATIAGTPCGQDFVIPFAPTYFQSEIPASIVNPTWFQQNVTFVLTVTNLAGQQIGTSEVRVTASATPFSW